MEKMSQDKRLPCTLYFASGNQTKAPYLKEMLAFVHLDMEIRNPMMSECGRFGVDPKYYGFDEYHTGGGCMALRKMLPCGEYLLLTDSDGTNIPLAEEWATALYGRYYRDGSPAIMITLLDVPMDSEE
jgi:hypothetical protein